MDSALLLALFVRVGVLPDTLHDVEGTHIHVRHVRVCVRETGGSASHCVCGWALFGAQPVGSFVLATIKDRVVAELAPRGGKAQGGEGQGGEGESSKGQGGGDARSPFASGAVLDYVDLGLASLVTGGLGGIYVEKTVRSPRRRPPLLLATRPAAHCCQPPSGHRRGWHCQGGCAPLHHQMQPFRSASVAPLSVRQASEGDGEQGGGGPSMASGLIEQSDLLLGVLVRASPSRVFPPHPPASPALRLPAVSGFATFVCLCNVCLPPCRFSPTGRTEPHPRMRSSPPAAARLTSAPTLPRRTWSGSCSSATAAQPTRPGSGAPSAFAPSERSGPPPQHTAAPRLCNTSAVQRLCNTRGGVHVHASNGAALPLHLERCLPSSAASIALHM